MPLKELRDGLKSGCGVRGEERGDVGGWGGAGSGVKGRGEGRVVGGGRVGGGRVGGGDGSRV